MELLPRTEPEVWGHGDDDPRPAMERTRAVN